MAKIVSLSVYFRRKNFCQTLVVKNSAMNKIIVLLYISSFNPAECSGSLLKRRAQAGVKVLVLLWDQDSRLQTIPSFQEFIQSAAETKEYFRGVSRGKCGIRGGRGRV